MTKTKFTLGRKILVMFMTLVMTCLSMVSMLGINASAADTQVIDNTTLAYAAEVTPLAPLSTESLSSLDSITKFFTDNKPKLLLIAGAIAIVCIILAGICFMFGRSGSQIAKGWLLNICIGIAIISAGTFIITLFSGS